MVAILNQIVTHCASTSPHVSIAYLRTEGKAILAVAEFDNGWVVRLQRGFNCVICRVHDGFWSARNLKPLKTDADPERDLLVLKGEEVDLEPADLRGTRSLAQTHVVGADSCSQLLAMLAASVLGQTDWLS